MYQSVRVCLLEIVRPVQRIKPGVEEELAPLASTENEAALCQPDLILGNDEIDLVRFKVGECFDDAIWRYHWVVFEHHTLDLV